MIRGAPRLPPPACVLASIKIRSDRTRIVPPGIGLPLLRGGIER
jgi:hypothetical protein